MIAFLSYGAIGLGLGLSILTYTLLKNEQRLTAPRASIITSIYAFMVFSIALSTIGFMSEFFNEHKDYIKSLQTISELSETVNKMKDHVDSMQTIITKLERMKHSIDLITGIKGAKLGQWDNYKQSDPDYVKIMREVRSDLKTLNESIRKELSLSESAK